MSSRNQIIETFLANAGWANPKRTLLAGDASNRRYERISQGDPPVSAVLMDAPPDKNDNTHAFVVIAKHLRDNGLSAPEIYAQDTDNGLLLLEDLGQALFAHIIHGTPSMERPLYEAATDLLIALRDISAPSLPIYDAQKLADLCQIAFSNYAGGMGLNPELQTTSRLLDRFADILHQSLKGPHVFAHRDYHAENLLWLPERTGVARVGLLDFQDAFLGHPAYDLVSLLQDVRRNVSPGIELQMINRYIQKTGSDEHSFRTAYSVLGAQRNLRILGVFARLSQEFGKPDYLEFVPAVWENLMRNLEHPALAAIADELRSILPPPTSKTLLRLRPT